MAWRWGSLARLLVWVNLAAGGVLLVRDAEHAPYLVFVALITTLGPLGRTLRWARGTALGPAVVWGFIAMALELLAQAAGANEALLSGRVGAGHWAYLATLAVLAALISVFNARRPGSGAWALLMALLVLVFLIPWLEGSGMAWQGAGWSRLRLEPPWTIFYLMLVIAGVTNYLPTRFGPASVWVALGLVLEYLSLTHPGWPRPSRAVVWSAGPWCFAAAVWTAEACALRPRAIRPGLERLWLWFRDHWGVVWAIRVRDRFNRNAELAGWPIRLGWFGIVPAPGDVVEETPDVLKESEVMLRGLLRRFADPDRLESEGA